MDDLTLHVEPKIDDELPPFEGSSEAYAESALLTDLRLAHDHTSGVDASEATYWLAMQAISAAEKESVLAYNRSLARRGRDSFRPARASLVSAKPLTPCACSGRAK